MGLEIALATSPSWQIGEQVASREAYGLALVELGKINPNIVVLDADLSSSTQTKFFAQQFPERFFNTGIAENNMMGIAAGLARLGKIPFASSFAMFACGRAWEFVRNSIAHNHLAVKVCATHAGLTVGEDGASHQIIEDIALMRVIPEMKVIVPADAIEAYQASIAIAQDPHPNYLRLSRAKSPVLYSKDYKFKIGQAHILKTGRDLTLIACGIMVARALEFAINNTELDIEVINSASIKPLDHKSICASAKKTGHVICLEEHSIYGGLSEAVAASLLENNIQATFRRIGIQDQFGQSGDAYKLLDHYGLGLDNIARVVNEIKAKNKS